MFLKSFYKINDYNIYNNIFINGFSNTYNVIR